MFHHFMCHKGKGKYSCQKTLLIGRTIKKMRGLCKIENSLNSEG